MFRHAAARYIDRRQLLKSFAAAAGIVPFKGFAEAFAQVPPAPTNVHLVTKPVLTQNDFRYLGCMRMPSSGVDTTFAYGGLTGRKVNGQLRLFVFGNNPTLHDPVYELADTGSYNTDYTNAPRMSLVASWGDVYHGKRVTWINGTQSSLQYLIPGGLYWNEATQLLYWTYFDAYNVTVRPDWNLGASSLIDPASGSTTAYGPWRTIAVDGDGTNWYGASRIAGLTATPDGKMGGFGAYFVTTAAPWGPQLYSGGTWPTASTPAGYGSPDLRVPDRYLTYYFMGGQISASDGTFIPPLRAFRRPPSLSYVWHPMGTGIATEIDPSKNGGVGSWTNEDGLGGAIWIELPDKHGVVFSASQAGSPNANAGACGTGHIWYRNAGLGSANCSHGCPSPYDIAGPVTDAGFPAFMIYNPDDLTNVKNGSLVDYRVNPTSVVNLDTFGIKTAPIGMLGHAKAVRGFHFDPDRRLLFVRANSADDSIAGMNTDLIHVFAIA